MNYKLMKLTFGQKFTYLRQLTGRSQAETADLLKKPLTTYIRVEDDFIYPTESLLHKIAGLYQLNYEELLMIGEQELETSAE